MPRSDIIAICALAISVLAAALSAWLGSVFGGKTARKLWTEQYARARLDTKADAVASRRAETAKPLIELVNTMLTNVQLRTDGKGFCSLTITNRPKVQTLANGLDPFLDDAERKALGEMMGNLFSQEARADGQAACQAATQLGHWLAHL